MFIEASRPKYLENLHTEALEGLKMMQQEGTKHSSDTVLCLCSKLEVLHANMLITVCILLKRVCAPEDINTKNLKCHYKSPELTVTLLAETNNGVEYQDNESTIVSDTSYPELLFFLTLSANALLLYKFFPKKIVFLLLPVDNDDPHRQGRWRVYDRQYHC